MYKKHMSLRSEWSTICLAQNENRNIQNNLTWTNKTVSSITLIKLERKKQQQ